jgi:hypothetical protein
MTFQGAGRRPSPERQRGGLFEDWPWYGPSLSALSALSALSGTASRLAVLPYRVAAKMLIANCFERFLSPFDRIL